MLNRDVLGGGVEAMFREIAIRAGLRGRRAAVPARKVAHRLANRHLPFSAVPVSSNPSANTAIANAGTKNGANSR
jgi:hypothetical protein